MNGSNTRPRWGVWLALAAVVALLAAACAPATPTAESEAGADAGGVLAGTVTFGAAPVPGARVELRPPGWQAMPEVVAAEAVADANGQFVLEHPPVGEFTVVGVFPDGERDEGGWPQVIIAPDQAITGLVVPLERALTLLEPTSGAQVAEAPTLTWQAFEGAAQYRVMVIDAGTTELLADETVSGPSLTVAAALQPGRTYEWRVNALSLDGTLLASGGRLFTLSAEAGQAGKPAACAPANGEQAVFTSTEGGYCFAYPGGFTLGEAVGGRVPVLGPALDASPDPLRARLEVEVTQLAAGTTLHAADDEFVNSFGALASEIAREPFTLGGEPAILLHNVPARLSARVVLAVRGERQYALWFQPEGLPQAEADLELLFGTVTATFAFGD
jgi:hypothetical protein